MVAGDRRRGDRTDLRRTYDGRCIRTRIATAELFRVYAREIVSMGERAIGLAELHESRSARRRGFSAAQKCSFPFAGIQFRLQRNVTLATSRRRQAATRARRALSCNISGMVALDERKAVELSQSADDDSRKGAGSLPRRPRPRENKYRRPTPYR